MYPHSGGWDNLNRCFRTPVEQARITRVSRQQVQVCLQQIQKQVKRGGHFLLEHPLGSRLWKHPEVVALKQRYGFHRINMCAYGLKCPKTGLPMQKHTGIICSHPSFKQAARRCPCCPKHQHIEGQCGKGLSRSVWAGRCTPEFVKVVWSTIGPDSAELTVAPGEPINWSALQCECLAGEEEGSLEEVSLQWPTLQKHRR